MVLRPIDPERASGTALVEDSNRGGKASLSYLPARARLRQPHPPQTYVWTPYLRMRSSTGSPHSSLSKIEERRSFAESAHPTDGRWTEFEWWHSGHAPNHPCSTAEGVLMLRIANKQNCAFR